MPPKDLETTQKVEFRWRQHEEMFAQLLAESAREAGRAIGDQARELVKTALTKDQQLHHAIHTLQQEVAQLHSQLRKLLEANEALRAIHENLYNLRDDLATYATKLLTDAGRLDAKAAKHWVEQALGND